MADTKISALTALAGSAVAADDLFAVVDTSATATKKITAEELENWIDSRAHTFAQTQTINPVVDTTALEIVHPVDSTGDLISATMEASQWFVVASDGSVFTRANLRLGSGSAVGTSGQTVIAVGNGTAPTTYPADEFQVWSADISAGNAAMHVAGEGLVAAVAVGGVTVRQKAGTAGTHEGRLSHSGTEFIVTSVTGPVNISPSSGRVGLKMVAAVNSEHILDVYDTDGTTIRTYVTNRGTATRGLVVGTVIGSTLPEYDAALFSNILVITSGFLRMSSDSTFGWNSSSGNPNGSAIDTRWSRGAVGVAVLDDTSTGGWVQAKGESGVLTADVTNDTATMANLTGLSKPVLSGRKYTFKLVLILNESTDADGAKVDFDGGTATATYFKWTATAFDSTTFIGLAHGATLAADFTALTLNGDGQIVIEGHFVPSASGTFIPRFAQAAHSTGTLTAYRGSYLWIKDTP